MILFFAFLRETGVIITIWFLFLHGSWNQPPFCMFDGSLFLKSLICLEVYFGQGRLNIWELERIHLLVIHLLPGGGNENTL